MTPQERTADRLRRAVNRRVALVRVLAEPGPNGGGLCANCKTEHGHGNLEIDHVDGILWDRYKMSPQMRAAKYWREHRAGVRLRALCSPCNGVDGATNKKKTYRQRRRRFA
jgi:hypothetical protein